MPNDHVSIQKLDSVQKLIAEALPNINIVSLDLAYNFLTSVNLYDPVLISLKLLRSKNPNWAKIDFLRQYLDIKSPSHFLF